MKINELIKELCPNGVEWKTVQNVILSLKTGLNPRDNFVLNAGDADCYYITGKEIQNNKIQVSDKTDLVSKDVVQLINKRAQLHSNVLLFASTGTGTVGRMAIVGEYNGKWNVSETLYIITPKNCILLRFLMYVLYSTVAVNQFAPKISKGSVPHLKVVDLLKTQIPIPPLDIQTRIVEILDHFTNLTANLTAELNLRRKQFEHYREKLLSLDGVEMVKLFDVAKNSTGLTYKPSDVSDSGTLVLRSSNIQNSMLCFDNNVFVKMKSIPTRALVKENDILVCVRNGSSTLIGKAAIIDKSCEGMAFGAFMTILRAFNINYKYLFYVWQSDRIQKMVHGDSGAPINQITNAVLDKIMIPYPSEDTQHSIVSILDKFTALIENIEKELALRQKQYEYYREQLLTFKS